MISLAVLTQDPAIIERLTASIEASASLTYIQSVADITTEDVLLIFDKLQTTVSKVSIPVIYWGPSAAINDTNYTTFDGVDYVLADSNVSFNNLKDFETCRVKLAGGTKPKPAIATGAAETCVVVLGSTSDYFTVRNNAAIILKRFPAAKIYYNGITSFPVLTQFGTATYSQVLSASTLICNLDNDKSNLASRAAQVFTLDMVELDYTYYPDNVTRLLQQTTFTKRLTAPFISPTPVGTLSSRITGIIRQYAPGASTTVPWSNAFPPYDRKNRAIQLVRVILRYLGGDFNVTEFDALCTAFSNQIGSTFNMTIINLYYRKYAFKERADSPVTVFNKWFKDSHRFGWDAAVTDLQYVIAKTPASQAQPQIIDTYLDRTFLWDNLANLSTGAIPYTRPWTGILHHTFNDYDGNSYSANYLFKNYAFLESLKNCRGIYVLSNDLKWRTEDALKAIGYTSIPVTKVWHPTGVFDVKHETPVSPVNLTQVGSYLRNMYTMHKMHVSGSPLINEKRILQSTSTSYCIPDFFLYDLYNSLNEISNTTVNTSTTTICRDTFGNMFLKSLYKSVVDEVDSVTQLAPLNNLDFDKMLTDASNVVFLRLEGASAVNTVIECIATNTPIIVNDLPAVKEYLGDDYPLLYSSELDDFELSKYIEALTLDDIIAAHTYLTNKDKAFLSFDNWKNVCTSIVSIASSTP